jgi:hypothetical protein
LLSFVLLAALGAGCSRAIKPPRLDPRAAAAQAFADYDTNKDGFLDDGELTRCPGLRACLRRCDKDRDGKLSLAELEEGLESYSKSGTGLLEVVCTVRLDSSPLPGAEVLFEPEPFLGPGIKPARRTTDDRGQARLKVEGAPASGCHLGIYRVRITKEGQVPARYNTPSQLGVEVAPDSTGVFTFRLTSRP